MLKVCLWIASLALWTSAASHAADAQSDAAKGRAVFAQCQICHSLDNGRNGVGPSLYGLFGRRSGSVPEFNYSEAMKSANVTWSDDTLFKYLADPKAYLPGVKMPFPGVKDEQLRRDVIAFLKEATR